MAQERYQQLMNLALDGLITEEEERELDGYLMSSDGLTGEWDELNMVDALLKHHAKVEMPPPPDFTMGVMARVEAYEAQRRWTPWMIGILAFISVLAALNIAMPILFFSLELYKPLAALPAFGAVLTAGAHALNAVGLGLAALADWLEYLLTDPVALGISLSALVLASTWIGMREGLRLMSQEAPQAQELPA
jgi:Co/Zn/Cd efflux system component